MTTKATKKTTVKKATAKKIIAIRSKDNKHNAGSVSTVGKKAPTAKKAVAKKVKELSIKDELALFDKDSSGKYVQEVIMENAEELYEGYLDSLHYYTPFTSERKPFRVANESITKNSVRGSIYNRRGVKIASYRKSLVNHDALFQVSFVDKQSKESFSREVRTSYDVHGFGDFGVFMQPSFNVDNEAISRYVTFLYSRKYPKKVEDFIDEALHMDKLEKEALKVEHLRG